MGSVTATPDASTVERQETDEAVRPGHEAVSEVLVSAGQPWKFFGRLLVLPGITRIAAKVYRLVADNRYRLPGSTPACAVSRPSDPGRSAA